MDKTELKEIFDRFLIENEKTNRYYDNSNPYKNFDANYPDCILMEIEKGGSRGGNCWNDNPSMPFEREDYIIENDISSEITNRIRILMDELNVKLDSRLVKLSIESLARNAINKEVHETYNNEWYGNYTTQNIYAIKLGDLIRPLLTDDEDEVFQKRLEAFILEKKPELLQQNSSMRNNNKYN